MCPQSYKDGYILSLDRHNFCDTNICSWLLLGLRGARLLVLRLHLQQGVFQLWSWAIWLTRTLAVCLNSVISLVESVYDTEWILVCSCILSVMSASLSKSTSSSSIANICWICWGRRWSHNWYNRHLSKRRLRNIIVLRLKYDGLLSACLKLSYGAFRSESHPLYNQVHRVPKEYVLVPCDCLLYYDTISYSNSLPPFSINPSTIVDNL